MFILNCVGPLYFQVQDLLSKVDTGTGSHDNRVGGVGQGGVVGGGGVVSGGGGGGGTSVDGDGATSSVKSRRMSRRMSGKELSNESDRQLKKLFRAITDGDVNLVSAQLKCLFFCFCFLLVCFVLFCLIPRVMCC